MARSGTKTRPGLTLIGLIAIIAILYGWVAFGSTQSANRAGWTPKLGIDLEGGTELILQAQGTANQQKPTADQMNEAISIIRQRVNGSGISEAQVAIQGSDQIVVRIPGKNPDQKTLNLVEQSAAMSFRPVLVTGSTGTTTTPTSTASPTSSTGSTPSASSSSGSGQTASTATATKSSSRVAPAAFAPQAKATAASKAVSTATSTAGSSDTTSSSTSSSVTDQNSADNSAAAGTPSDLKQLDETTTVPFLPAGDKTTATIEQQFEALTCNQQEMTNLTANSASVDPDKPTVTCTDDGSTKLALGPVAVKGEEIKSASSGVGTNSQGFSTGEYIVQLNFKGTGTKQFAATTQRLVNLTGDQNSFAIVLDGTVVSYPGVQSAITTGEAQISGSFTQATAAGLAQQLKFGALPMSFSVQTDTQISALLGTSQLQHGLLAGLIGLILVVIYSLLQYRALGLVTVFSLIFASAVTYSLVLVLSWQNNYRLSLAGVAGLIVSIGITADSFIVYFERVRDEVREGRPLKTAVEAGWQRARRTILISDAVNFLAAVVLYLLAVGDVRGFAFTLGLTTLVDVLIVFMFTKPAVTLLSRTAFFDGGHPASGFSAEQLGRAPAYTGRGRVRTPSGPSIAERRAAAQQAAEQDGDDGESSSGSLASTRRNS